ncbi:hypothetical protein [Methyloceanibacter sp.]|uniref:hypothetical protein n=1 Tax=Methyloceanibacter sp. TaxID=1965321 RepID=UPI002D4B3430|nr:hypothetical protein [Methyloceanibacter sp.]HZP09772.1 hypothetical protein [Methyloceanibacter sp.]
MTVRRFISGFAALMALACVGLAGVAIGASLAKAETAGIRLAEDDVPGDKSLIQDEPTSPSDEQSQTGSHAPKYPIRFKTVDYQDAGDTGKLTLAGTAPPETPVYIYFDDQPFVKVMADKDGNWSTEKEVGKLDQERHMLRAEQYDMTTRMVSGRAMVTLARAPEDAAPPQAGQGESSGPH